MITLYDTTLRDGTQREGLSLSVEDKLRICRRLDDLGVHYIEGGWPNPTNPKDLEFFDRVRDLAGVVYGGPPDLGARHREYLKEIHRSFHPRG